MISMRLRKVFDKALRYAKKHKHQYLTIEHIFLILLDDEKISSMLKDLSISCEELKEELSDYIQTNIPKAKVVLDMPVQTVTLVSITDKMIRNIGKHKREISVEDMFVYILKDKNAYATYLLRKQGLERVEILDNINENDDGIEVDFDSIEDDVLKSNSQELVALALKGKLDDVYKREHEISRVIEVLSRRKKNNPILVGESGVGKTSIAEGLAIAIAREKVPTCLKDAKIYSLDMGSLVAGTKYRGDFEQKLKQLIKEVLKIPKAILFIDEIHTVIGAGSVSSGSMDASNILKPLLATGKIKCIGATTYEEYRGSFGKDKAFARRFCKIDVDEPSIQNAKAMIKGLTSKYEKFHNVTYSNEAVSLAVELSSRFITDRYLPDSAIDVLDESAASKKLLFSKNAKQIQINTKDIEKTIAKIAKIPPNSATTSDIKILKSLHSKLKKSIFGQDEAIDVVTEHIRINRAGLGGVDKPIASFLFSGPTGVGKTQLAKELANTLGIHFERFDMSEYGEAHSVSRLIGAPAGYVGYEKGGLLTEAIKNNPHCVLLLDEIEKANIELMSILLQVMDNAVLTDNNGSKISFQNVILIMSSNLGATSDSVVGFTKDEGLNEDKAIKMFFSPEFRNRLDGVIKFKPLQEKFIHRIVSKFLTDMTEGIKDKDIKITAHKRAIKQLAKMGYDKAMGARPLQRVIQKEIKSRISNEILFGSLLNGGKVMIDYVDGKFVFDFASAKLEV